MTDIARVRNLMGAPGGFRSQMIRGGIGSAINLGGGRILALGLGIVLARGLGADGYGEYAYAFAIMSLLMVVAEAGVPILLMREVAASLERREWSILRGAMMRGVYLVLIVSILISITGLLTLWVFAGHIRAVTLQTVALMLLVLPLAALARVVAATLRGLQRVVTGQIVDMVIRPSLALIAVSAIFVVTPMLRQPQYAMAAQLGAATVTLLVGWRVLVRCLPDASSAQPAEYPMRRWLKSAFPFILIGGAGIINNQTDIIMLGWFRSAEEVGIYRVATQGAALVAFGLQASNAVIAPQFARLYAQGDMQRLQRLATTSARVVLIAALPIAFAFVLAGGTIASFFFGNEFTSSHAPLAILAMGQLANAAFGSVGFLLHMTGNENLSARALWQTAILNIILNAILIPPYGNVGAAIATAICVATWNMLLFYFVYNRLGITSIAIPFSRV